MSFIENRPRFRHKVSWTQQELIERVEAHIHQPNSQIKGSVVRNHIFLKLPHGEHHSWTPQLTIELQDLKEGGTLVRGLIGPGASIWTRFVFMYSFSGFVILFGLITGVPQWMLNKTPMGLLVMALGCLMVGGVFLMAQSGKKLAAPQSEQLRNWWISLVEEAASPFEEADYGLHIID